MKKLFFLVYIPFGFASANLAKPEIDLSQYEKKYFSEHGEDGVIEQIFEIIGTESKYYVEFGVQDGKECNTRYFREKHGFTGLMMDMDFQDPSINFHKEVITAENINDLLNKYKVPHEFDLLSIDIDSNDFYVWLVMQCSPRVVVIEYNPDHQPFEDKVVVYDPKRFWDQTSYFGASFLAMYKLGRVKGYSLVYAEKSGCNMFFIRNDILNQIPYTFKNIYNVRRLYQRGYHAPDPLNREYVSSESVIRHFFRSMILPKKP